MGCGTRRGHVGGKWAVVPFYTLPHYMGAGGQWYLSLHHNHTRGSGHPSPYCTRVVGTSILEYGATLWAVAPLSTPGVLKGAGAHCPLRVWQCAEGCPLPSTLWQCVEGCHYPPPPCTMAAQRSCCTLPVPSLWQCTGGGIAHGRWVVCSGIL